MPIYKYQYTDGGKSLSKRPKQINDCTVRALAIVANIAYDEAYDLLSERGRICNKRFFFPNKAKDDCIAGLILKWKSFPAIKGQERMNIGKFGIEHPKGIYVCKTAKHVFAVIDGVVYDSFESYPERCIYGMWTVTKG